MTYGQIQEALDWHFLQYMAEMSPWKPSHDGRPQWFFAIRHFTNEWLDRDTCAAYLRNLTRRGLCRYSRGLMGEDGELAGSGYGITSLGIERYRHLAYARGWQPLNPAP